MADTSSSARRHIEEIRRVKFSIGGEPNPLTEDLHHAVKNLSAELYAKDIHFLMELIQNAEDNGYSDGVEPSLEFVITSRDLTCTGANATLLVLNNEIGFNKRNIESICSVGRSTKKGRRQEGFVGEKGIGFKSVFLVTSQPYIFSNGYQIKFTEEQSSDCNVGYIVPQWVESNPTVTEIHNAYGLDKALPMTVIVLPLRSEKVSAVKQQLSSIHPELLLFLSKIKHVSVRERNDDPLIPGAVSAISITSEKEFGTRKDIDADSQIVFLSAEEGEDGTSDQCNYYMWKQRFPVKAENKVEVRQDIEEWVITLAFPFGDRLKRGSISAGVYSFLPTEMVTNFPFIIQADFLLTSSRETILLDSKWNKGILECVPLAFANALGSLAKSLGDAPISSMVHMFDFLPVQESPFKQLNTVRDAIREKIQDEYIMPCETFSEQLMFRRPCEVARILPTFREILLKLKKQGVLLKGISSHGTCVLHSDADLSRFDRALGFLRIQLVSYSWYAKCIQGCGLVLQADDGTYVQLLCFLADNWSRGLAGTDVEIIPLLKYVDECGKVSVCSVRTASYLMTHKLHYASDSQYHAWMNKWNIELRCLEGFYMLPDPTVQVLKTLSCNVSLYPWLTQYVRVKGITASGFATYVASCLGRSRDRNLVLCFTHFLYHAFSRGLIYDFAQLCSLLPLIGRHGTVILERKQVLVPSSCSKWVNLLGLNPFPGEGYVELGDDYLREGHFAGDYTKKGEILHFMEKILKASDLPTLRPPNVELPAASSSLTKEKAFLLLDWILKLRSTSFTFGSRFMQSIQNGKWLKTCSGFNSPNQCFLSDTGGNFIFSQTGNVGLRLSVIDEDFYGQEIRNYKNELILVGVKHGLMDTCKIISKHFTCISASGLTKDVAISLLSFVRYLKLNHILADDFIKSVKSGHWLKTTKGYSPPKGAVYLPHEREDISQIANLAFIDDSFYGPEINSYRGELKMMDVIVDLCLAYPMIIKNFRLCSIIPTLSSKSGMLILNCIRNCSTDPLFVQRIKNFPWLNTNIGFMCPSGTILSDPSWESVSQVVEVAVVDRSFYGNDIISFKGELKLVGVAVEFSEASRIVASTLHKLASASILTSVHVYSLLNSLKSLRATPYSPLVQFKQSLLDDNWLLTRCGNRPARSSILFDQDWKSVADIADLPFIDDDFYGKSIYSYKDELRSMGVVTDYNEGFQFVALGLKIPSTPHKINPHSVVCLLQCIRSMLLQSLSKSLPTGFLQKTREVKWLRTQFGYKDALGCFLFDSSWEHLLKITDAPFIDDKFYGGTMSSYKNELRALGVLVDVGTGCSVIANTLQLHTDFDTIKRLYSYLERFRWLPEDNSGSWVWIPKESCSGGDFVGPRECVVTDTSNLFESRFKILEKYYKEPLLSFFSSALAVQYSPSVDDYLELWKEWEDARGDELNYSQCCSFWTCIVRIWNLESEKRISEGMSKLPAKAATGGILLVDKRDVFIADDLQLMSMFRNAYPKEPLFVWYPDDSLESIPMTKLYDIYRCIGVKKLSDSILKCADSLNLDCELHKLDSRGSPIKGGLIKLILGFLADAKHAISAERRQEIANTLLDLDVFEAGDSITVSYSLLLPSQSKSLAAKGTDVIRWEKDSKRLIIKKAYNLRQRDIMEFATNFSRVLSNGILWDSTCLIEDLSRIMKIACLVRFDMEAVNYLMMTENLQLFQQDVEFMSTALSIKKDLLDDADQEEMDGER